MRAPARELVAVVQEEDTAVHVDGGADAQVRHAVARRPPVRVARRAAHALRILHEEAPMHSVITSHRIGPGRRRDLTT